MKKFKLSLQEMYDGDEATYEAFLADLDVSLNPRSYGSIYDSFATLGVSDESLILDAGCRDARHMCRLAEQYGARFEGIDIVESNIVEANKKIVDKGLQDRINAQVGDLLDMPFEDEYFDFLWCRDVLGHIEDLGKAFDSFFRVLKPGGKAFVFHVFSTDLLTEKEADDMYLPAAIYVDSTRKDYFEASYEKAGFRALEIDTISSEWREHEEEKGGNISSLQLLRIAKLLRNKEAYIEKYGETEYYLELSNCHYGVYQMLGKMCARVYFLEKSI